jgi:hypothetical protein
MKTATLPRIIFGLVIGAWGVSTFAQVPPSGTEQPGKPAGETGTSAATGATTSAMGIATALPTDSIVVLGGQLFLVREKQSILVDADVFSRMGFVSLLAGSLCSAMAPKPLWQNGQTVTPQGEGKIVRLPGGYVLSPLAGTVTAQPSPTK